MKLRLDERSFAIIPETHADLAWLERARFPVGVFPEHYVPSMVAGQQHDVSWRYKNEDQRPEPEDRAPMECEYHFQIERRAEKGLP